MNARKRQTKLRPSTEITEDAREGREAEGGKVVDLAASVRQSEREKLNAIATHGPTDQACALAQGADLDEKLIDLLARRPEREVLYALANNGRAKLGRKALRPLMERGRNDPNLARALLRRESLHLCHFRLFLQADAEERGHLIAVARQSRLALAHGPDGNPDPDAGKLARLEYAALARNRASFDLALAHALSCDLSAASEIAADKGGEALALTLAALGLRNESAARIFLAGFPEICDSGKKFRALMRIVESMPRRTAARLVQAVIAMPAAPAAA